MLKITTSDSRATRVLQLEGKLLSGWVSELLTACQCASLQYPNVELDLSGLSFADVEGIEVLRQLAERGIRLTHCSPFIGELIGRITDERRR